MQITLVCAFEEWNIGKFKTLNNFDKFCCGDQKFEFVFACLYNCWWEKFTSILISLSVAFESSC